MGAVVDDGGYNGNGAAVQAANVAPGSSDLQALQVAGDSVYQNSSGLVCAIDDGNGAGQVPANGVQNCLASSGSDYYYWAYWVGDPYTNTWTYANIGPAEHSVNSGQTYVEGWSYQNPGPDNPNAAKPSVSPATAFARACPGVQPGPSGGSGGGGGSGGSSGGGTGGTGGGSLPATPSPSAATTTTTSPVGGGSPVPRTEPGSPASSGTNTTTTHPGSGTAAPPDGTHATSTTPTGGVVAQRGDGKTALAYGAAHRTSGGGDPALPIMIIAAVIVLLGGLAWWRWRRRPVEE